MHRSTLSVLVGVIVAAIMWSQPAAAEGYPERLVRVIVGYTPGGPADSIARSIAERLSKKWGQSVIVENMPGASGALGANSVLRSAPDGYTLLLTDTASFVILPHLRAKLPFDPRTDFVPITMVARQAAVLAARKGFPPNSIAELITYAKANPGKVTFGSFGMGTYAHVKMEELAKDANITMLHVPYRGAAQVVTDMLGDRIDLFLGAIGLFEAHEAAGALKILATGTEKRLAYRPDLPTIAESGVPGYSVSVWFGLVGPAGMPPAIADKIQQDVAAVLDDPDYKEKYLAPQRLQGGGETTAQFKAIIATEFERWRLVIKDLGITMPE
jgi:tripartite-type tricarboxylate transporter receptor subunit TctC